MGVVVAPIQGDRWAALRGGGGVKPVKHSLAPTVLAAGSRVDGEEEPVIFKPSLV